MSILDDIRRVEAERVNWQFSSEDLDDAAQSREAAVNEAWEKRLSGKIILDPKLDPDPYGDHRIALVDRLKAMGWP